jgi:hypothetical protein
VKKACWGLALLVCCALVVFVAGCGNEAANDTTTVSAVTTTAVSFETTTTASTLAIATSPTLAITASPAWTQLQPVGAAPSQVGQASIFYDPEAKKVILLGGYPQSFQEIWEYDLALNTWTQLTPVGPTPPSQRFSPHVVYDAESDKLTTVTA